MSSKGSKTAIRDCVGGGSLFIDRGIEQTAKWVDSLRDIEADRDRDVNPNGALARDILEREAMGKTRRLFVPSVLNMNYPEALAMKADDQDGKRPEVMDSTFVDRLRSKEELLQAFDSLETSRARRSQLLEKVSEIDAENRALQEKIDDGLASLSRKGTVVERVAHARKFVEKASKTRRKLIACHSMRHILRRFFHRVRVRALSLWRFAARTESMRLKHVSRVARMRTEHAGALKRVRKAYENLAKQSTEAATADLFTKLRKATLGRATRVGKHVLARTLRRAMWRWRVAVTSASGDALDGLKKKYSRIREQAGAMLDRNDELSREISFRRIDTVVRSWVHRKLSSGFRRWALAALKGSHDEYMDITKASYDETLRGASIAHDSEIDRERRKSIALGRKYALRTFAKTIGHWQHRSLASAIHQWTAVTLSSQHRERTSRRISKYRDRLDRLFSDEKRLVDKANAMSSRAKMAERARMLQRLALVMGTWRHRQLSSAMRQWAIVCVANDYRQALHTHRRKSLVVENDLRAKAKRLHEQRMVLQRRVREEKARSVIGRLLHRQLAKGFLRWVVNTVRHQHAELLDGRRRQGNTDAVSSARNGVGGGGGGNSDGSCRSDRRETSAPAGLSSVAAAIRPMKNPQPSDCPTDALMTPEGAILRAGDRVVVKKDGGDDDDDNDGTMAGYVRMIGPCHFKPGLWIGVELDHPNGRHDGSVDGRIYFVTNPSRGIFCRPWSLRVLGDSVYDKSALDRDRWSTYVSGETGETYYYCRGETSTNVD